MAAVPEAEINRQVALKDDFNAHGFKTLSAIGIVVCTVLVGLRLWSRRWQKIGWKADDYVIMLAWVSKCFLPRPSSSRTHWVRGEYLGSWLT